MFSKCQLEEMIVNTILSQRSKWMKYLSNYHQLKQTRKSLGFSYLFNKNQLTFCQLQR